MAQEFGLGRGLSSLIPQKTTSVKKASATAPVQTSAVTSHAQDVPRVAKVAASDDGVHSVAIAQIVPNPHQPRRHFDTAALKELAASIAEHGILQPPVVSRRTESDGYELIAGERRLRAAQLAGLTEIPVIVRMASERQKMELALIENIQRHDLDVVEEAKAYRQLAQAYGLSQEDVAQRVGKSRSVVANRLRLLTLPVTILRALRDGVISEGHAKVILSVEDAQAQQALFEVITREHLTVRQAEMRVKKMGTTATVRTSAPKVAPLPAVTAAQKKLADVLETRVNILPRGRGGKIVIDYFAPEDLRMIVQKIQMQTSVDCEEQ